MADATMSWRSLILRATFGFAVIVLVLAAILVTNTLLATGPATTAVATVEKAPLDAASARRLSTAIGFRTVSSLAAAAERDAFLAFHDFLRQSFPLVHERLVRTEHSGLSLLYEWKGSDPAARPVLFLAHQDVVPAAEPGSWTHPPFSGAIADGYVWGRGAMDDKCSLMGWLEAVEQLLAEGFRPNRTVYLAFGHDEETGGQGARSIAGYLGERGVRLELVLDEGGFVGRGLLPGIDAPIALVGTAEKGYLTVELTAEEEGGHSSRPPEQTAIGRISRAIVRLEENPFPPAFSGATEEMFEQLAPHLPFAQRLVLVNRWLLEPVLLSVLEGDPDTATIVKTTTAATMFRAGEKDNVLPQEARATVNLRILPGETVEGALERVRRVIDDVRVQVSTVIATEPSPISSTKSPAWDLLARTIREVLGNDIIVTPYLMVAATDSRHFIPVSDDVYRFFGMTVTQEDIARFHGVDERISMEDYGNLIAVYYRLLRNLDH